MFWTGPREQLAIAEFAILFLIPKTLAVKRAKDSTELVAKLRSYHNAAQNAPAGDPKKVLQRYGLDLLNGRFATMSLQVSSNPPSARSAV